MFNFNDLFPTIDCANNYLNFLDIFEGTSISQVINNTGPTQDQLATFLTDPSLNYFINATKDPTISYLYKYAEMTGSMLNLYHYVNSIGVTNPGGCLSLKSSDGQLQFQGASCEDLLTPLCFRKTNKNITVDTCSPTCSSESE